MYSFGPDGIEYKDLEPNDSKLFIYKRWDEKNLFLIAGCSGHIPVS